MQFEIGETIDIKKAEKELNKQLAYHDNFLDVNNELDYCHKPMQ